MTQAPAGDLMPGVQAVRLPGKGRRVNKAHRMGFNTSRWTSCVRDTRGMEQVPLSQVAFRNRCKVCWPNTGETQ